MRSMVVFDEMRQLHFCRLYFHLIIFIRRVSTSGFVWDGFISLSFGCRICGKMTEKFRPGTVLGAGVLVLAGLALACSGSKSGQKAEEMPTLEGNILTVVPVIKPDSSIVISAETLLDKVKLMPREEVERLVTLAAEKMSASNLMTQNQLRDFDFHRQKAFEPFNDGVQPERERHTFYMGRVAAYLVGYGCKAGEIYEVLDAIRALGARYQHEMLVLAGAGDLRYTSNEQREHVLELYFSIPCEVVRR